MKKGGGVPPHVLECPYNNKFYAYFPYDFSLNYKQPNTTIRACKLTINLFLDTNILLSFYALSNSDIGQLKELTKKTKSGDIKLFVSEQLISEVERNRDSKIEEAFKVFKANTFRCQAPAFIKPMGDFTELQESLKKANKSHANLVKTVNKKIEERQLDADKLIEELFANSEVSKTTKKLYKKALKRFHTGKPPGKKKVTLGDELHWEFLLDEVPEGEDLHLVSLDGDFSSVNDAGKINAALSAEWKKKKKSELIFYKELDEFFKNHIPKIKLAHRKKLDAVIERLSTSGSYATTHALIAEFPDEADFSDSQILALKEVFETNSQVKDIHRDADVNKIFIIVKERLKKISTK